MAHTHTLCIHITKPTNITNPKELWILNLNVCVSFNTMKICSTVGKSSLLFNALVKSNSNQQQQQKGIPIKDIYSGYIIIVLKIQLKSRVIVLELFPTFNGWHQNAAHFYGLTPVVFKCWLLIFIKTWLKYLMRHRYDLLILFLFLFVSSSLGMSTSIPESTMELFYGWR